MSKLIPSSLTGRLFVVSMLVIALFLPLAGLVLEQAYSNSLDRRLQEQLKVQVYGLMGLADELEPGNLWLPESLPDERFNQLASGRYAQVINSLGKTVWRSQSSLNIVFPEFVNDALVPPGQFVSESIGSTTVNFLETTRVSVIWEGIDDTENLYTFMVGESITPYLAEKNAFRQTLLLWLGGLGAFLLIINFFALFWAIRPLKQLANEIHQVETGETQLLETDYPTELNRVAKNLNALISHEQEQRSRYRNTLQDLAHSLKTPLSVLQGNLSKIENKEVKATLSEHISRMSNIVGYQLQRAVTAGSSPIKQKVNVQSCIVKIFNALNKVYFDKKITLINNVDENCLFYGDENDLLEILGNLCDNACKYGNSEVSAAVTNHELGSICISIIDNGPGIPKKMQQIIFQRGERLDENNEGQGIGLSIVSDIVASYKGSIKVIDYEKNKNTIQVILPGSL